MSDSPDDIPDFAELAADPAIAALLDFEPVPRKRNVEGGWTPELQREFIARLATHGSPGRACEEMGKNLTGMMKLYRSPLAASFRGSWHAAIDRARTRRAEAAPGGPPPMAKPPTIDHRIKHGRYVQASHLQRPAEGAEGQVRNEYGEWEDEGSLARRVEEARDSISDKLLRARRLYLREISGHPARRAAFEILTELPVDWEKAQALEPQPDEPWARPNMRKPDMLLTAEAGWLGDAAHGPDKKAELMHEINAWRAKRGLEAVEWSEPDSNPPRNGEGDHAENGGGAE